MGVIVPLFATTGNKDSWREMNAGARLQGKEGECL